MNAESRLNELTKPVKPEPEKTDSVPNSTETTSNLENILGIDNDNGGSPNTSELETVRQGLSTEIELTSNNGNEDENKGFTPPEKKGIRELYKLSKDPEKSKKYFIEVLKQEQHEDRLTKWQLDKFIKEADDFEFDRVIKDGVWPLRILAGMYAGIGLGAVVAGISIKEAAEILAKATIAPISVSGIIRSPMLNWRAFEEMKKIKNKYGTKEALKTIPFYLGLNVLNLIPIVDWMAPVMVTFPQNKDVGLAFINNKVQTGRSPKFFKRFVNWGVQKMFEKPKTQELDPEKPSKQPKPERPVRTPSLVPAGA
ncbi:hypothetical protein ACFLZ1_00510 [Patescibacteria group bacterium]